MRKPTRAPKIVPSRYTLKGVLSRRPDDGRTDADEVSGAPPPLPAAIRRSHPKAEPGATFSHLKQKQFHPTTKVEHCFTNRGADKMEQMSNWKWAGNDNGIGKIIENGR